VAAAGHDREAERTEPEREDKTTHRSHGSHDAPLLLIATEPGARGTSPPTGPQHDRLLSSLGGALRRGRDPGCTASEK
jgi:hypothetical protein